MKQPTGEVFNVWLWERIGIVHHISTRLYWTKISLVLCFMALAFRLCNIIDGVLQRHTEQSHSIATELKTVQLIVNRIAKPKLNRVWREYAWPSWLTFSYLFSLKKQSLMFSSGCCVGARELRTLVFQASMLFTHWWKRKEERMQAECKPCFSG